MTDAVHDEIAYELAMYIGRVNRLLRGPGAEALGHGHLSALGTIVVDGPLRLGDLAAREVSSAPSMARTVTALEQRGLVVRIPDPDDGRGVYVHATRAGEQAVRRARAERGAALAALMDTLSPVQRRNLAAALSALEQISEAR